MQSQRSPSRLWPLAVAQLLEACIIASVSSGCITNITAWAAATSDVCSPTVLGLEPATQVRAGLVSPEASPGHVDSHLVPVSSHSCPSACRHPNRSSYKDTSHTGLGPTPLAPFNLITSIKALSPGVVTC